MEREEEKTVIHNHFATGANCQVFNSPVRVGIIAMPGAHVVQQAATETFEDEKQESATSDEQDGIVRQLLSAFYGNEKDAREFLAAIQGMSPVQITETVKRWVADGRISELSKNRALWRVLHDNGLYPRTEPNWNSRIK